MRNVVRRRDPAEVRVTPTIYTIVTIAGTLWQVL
jgi:hypothetical protein